jgi:hypothetical protein
MDSEDEWAEENGEDIYDENAQKYSDDNEDDMLAEEEAKGFIVDDFYLSVSEMNFSKGSKDDFDENQIKADIERKKVIVD